MEDIKQKIQEAGGFLRTAERNMFSGKNQEAVELLNKADEIAASVAKIQPADFQVTSLIQKIEKLRKDLEKKGVVTRPGGKPELPFEVNAQLQRIKECVLSGNLERSQAEMKDYYNRFAGPHTDIPEIKELSTLIKKLEEEDVLKKQKASEATQSQASERVEHEKLCALWREKLKTVPYFDGTAHNVIDLAAHMEGYQKAVKVINEYKTVTFAMEQDYTLQSMVEDIKRRIETLIPNYQATLNDMSGEIMQRIEVFITQLNNDTAWEKDESKLPSFVNQSQLTEFLQSIEEMKPLCTEDMQVYNGMMLQYQKLVDLNEERKKKRATVIKMKPEVVSGPEAEPMIKAAIKALLDDHKNAEILKASVSKSWENKFEEGWEDNTKSKWIKKYFREARVQIAAKLADEVCKLFTFYVEETKISESEYGNIKSHIMSDELIDRNNI